MGGVEFEVGLAAGVGLPVVFVVEIGEVAVESSNTSIGILWFQDV